MIFFVNRYGNRISIYNLYFTSHQSVTAIRPIMIFIPAFANLKAEALGLSCANRGESPKIK